MRAPTTDNDGGGRVIQHLTSPPGIRVERGSFGQLHCAGSSDSLQPLILSNPGIAKDDDLESSLAGHPSHPAPFLQRVRHAG